MASTRAAAAGERVRVGCTYSEARRAARHIDAAEFTAFVLELYTSTLHARLRRSAASVAVAWRKINLLSLARSTSKVVGGWRSRSDDTVGRLQ